MSRRRKAETVVTLRPIERPSTIEVAELQGRFAATARLAAGDVLLLVIDGSGVLASPDDVRVIKADSPAGPP